MTARTRTAALAAAGAVGLVSLAYGIGGVVGNGSASAVGSSSGPAAQRQGPDRFMFTQDQAAAQGTRPRHPCPHHDGQGQGQGSGSSDTAPSTAPDPNSY